MTSIKTKIGENDMEEGVVMPESITFKQVIKFGEYDPGYLATFSEWHELTTHMQFQFVLKALDNREKQLRVQWAEIVNFLDFSEKTHLKDALRNIEKQMKKVEKDREDLYSKYSGVEI